MLDVLERILLVIWRIIRIIWIIAILGGIAQVNSGSHGEILFLIKLIVVLVIIELVIYGFKSRCPHCGKWFSLKRAGTKHIKNEDILILTEMQIRNNNGEVTGTQEQYVPGTRNFYQKNYICRKCGEMACRTYSKDKKNV